MFGKTRWKCSTEFLNGVGVLKILHLFVLLHIIFVFINELGDAAEDASLRYSTMLRGDKTLWNVRIITQN